MVVSQEVTIRHRQAEIALGLRDFYDRHPSLPSVEDLEAYPKTWQYPVHQRRALHRFWPATRFSLEEAALFEAIEGRMPTGELIGGNKHFVQDAARQNRAERWSTLKSAENNPRISIERPGSCQDRPLGFQSLSFTRAS